MRTLRSRRVKYLLSERGLRQISSHLGLSCPAVSVAVLSPFITTILSLVTYARPVLKAVCWSTKLHARGGSVKVKYIMSVEWKVLDNPTKKNTLRIQHLLAI